MKISIRYFNDKKLRSVYDDTTNKWYTSCTDLVFIFSNSKVIKTYWAKIKARNNNLLPHIKKFKLSGSDGKYYLADCIDGIGVELICDIFSGPKYKEANEWLSGKGTNIDVQSREKAYSLWNSTILDDIEVGTIKGLQQIHSYLFGGLYDFAGQIRDRNIAKGGYKFSPYQHFKLIFNNIDNMPESSLEDIIEKYVCMNMAHPFMEGNGRSTRIWLDLILKKNLKKCVDWSKISKEDYLKAMVESHVDSAKIYNLIKNALTNKIKDRTIFIKGIDYSYYYEGVEM